MSDVTHIAPLPITNTRLDASVQKTPDELKALAQQFESLLLSQMLKEMRQSMFDDEDKSTGFGGGPLADSVFSELTNALSRAGGVGLGQSLLEPITLAAGGAAAASYANTASLSPSISMGAPVGIDTRASATIAGQVTSSYGWRRDPVNGDLKFHKGVDLAMPVGQDVPTARAGSVASVGTLSGYGLTVVVDHGDGTSTRYAHLSEALVKAGDAVSPGETIARSGASGRTTGPHLHFEVLKDGRPVDPAAGW